MSDSSSTKSGGIGFMGVLAIVFIVMKLTGTGAVAAWSWWWVLSPLWLPLVIVLGIVLLCVFFTWVFGGFK